MLNTPNTQFSMKRVFHAAFFQWNSNYKSKKKKKGLKWSSGAENSYNLQFNQHILEGEGFTLIRMYFFSF